MVSMSNECVYKASSQEGVQKEDTKESRKKCKLFESKKIEIKEY